MRHHRGRVDHDDEDQPAQIFERHLLDDIGGDEDRRNAADGEPEHHPHVDLADADMLDAGARAHQAGAAGHDRKAEPRIHAHQAQDHQGGRVIAHPEIGEDAAGEIDEYGEDHQPRRQAVRGAAARE